MINGFGPIYGYLGYQVHARKFFEALDRLEPVCLVATNARHASFATDPHLMAMAERVAAINLSDPTVAIDYGSNFHHMAGRWRVGFTVFEYTRLSPDWLNGLRQVDAIWTTSQWGREVLIQNGLSNRPVGIVPEGFDPDVFHPGLKSRRRRDGVFRFLCVGKWEVRKGQAELLQAWAKAFSPKDPVELVLMCENPFVPGFSVASELQRLGLGKTAPVRLEKPATTDHDMAQIYSDADCFVLPSRAEGWGLPIMEAMACGTPVITTRYSAMTEYVSDSNAYLLDIQRLVPVYDPLFFPNPGERGQWAEISLDQLVSHLRHIATYREEAVAKGLIAATELKQTWTWADAAEKAHALLKAERAVSAEGFIHRPTHATEAAPRSVDPLTAAKAGDRSPAVLASLSITQLMEVADGLVTNIPAAAELYQRWLQHVTSPLAFVGRFNLARLLTDIGDLQGALEQYQLSLAQNPRFIQSWLNLGSIHERLGDTAAALAQWQSALGVLETEPKPDPDLLKHALNSLGRLLEQVHRFPEAEEMLTRSLTVDPNQDDVIHHLVHLRQKQCAWPVYRPMPGVTVEHQIKATSALAMLSASDDPALQLDTALRYVRAKVPMNLPSLAPKQGYGHSKLRIGYLSSNLNLHAVTILTAEVYELHDRERFEVYGFCWSPEDGTPMRQRIRAAMDHLIRIDTMSDEQAAQAIRAAEIDVLIDLQGLTSGCRPVILAHKPAPVAASWLGFPGTSGLPGVDYIIADRYLIPEDLAQFYSEKPLYLPDCFQSNDRKRAAGSLPLRVTYQLPEDALVFCAFNHNHKFSPEMFGTWMRILARVPDSVLWLLADNPAAEKNLTAFAEQQGIERSRLIFAPRVHPAEYLARFQLADLFLDTLPFNGGTTASDALWMGLPLLTCSGRTFASRMAGSLLQAVGLPELATQSLADYETMAVALAMDRRRLATLRERLQKNKATFPLFDTPRLVKALEDAFISVARNS
jgi:predicted O-linked N-acetylglucosamine transferase (SPINDLY family)/glycosyltransferase involved in cell wall biosynthesis